MAKRKIARTRPPTKKPKAPHGGAVAKPAENPAPHDTAPATTVYVTQLDPRLRSELGRSLLLATDKLGEIIARAVDDENHELERDLAAIMLPIWRVRWELFVVDSEIRVEVQS